MRSLRLVVFAALLLVTGLAASCSKQDGTMTNLPPPSKLLDVGDMATKPNAGQKETPRLPPARP